MPGMASGLAVARNTKEPLKGSLSHFSLKLLPQDS